MAGHIQKPIVQAITTGAWVAVALGTSQSCSEFIVHSRAKNSWKMSDVLAGTTYFTVWNGDAISIQLRAPKTATTGAILFYAQALAVNDSLEILIVR